MTTFRGGGSVGWLNASGIFSLDASKELLRLRVLAVGTYEFQPEDVVAIELKKGFIFDGVRIRHAVAKYPEKIVFHPLRASGVMDSIRETGFIPSAPAPLPSRPVPFRWSVALLAAGLYLALLIPYSISFLRAFMRATPPLLETGTAWATLAALGFVFVFVWGIRLGPLRPVILKPGRDFEEIKHWVNSLCLIVTLLFPIFSVTFLMTGRLHP